MFRLVGDCPLSLHPQSRKMISLGTEVKSFSWYTDGIIPLFFLASFTATEKPVVSLITTPLNIICPFVLYLRQCVSYVRLCESD